MAKDVLTVERALAMAAPFPLDAIREAATGLMDAYIWVYPVGNGKARHKECWCERCGGRYPLGADNVQQREAEMQYHYWSSPTPKPLPKTIHRQWYQCPKCGRRLEMRESFRPRKSIYQEVFLTWYWADSGNPDVLYSLGCVCSRDYQQRDRYDRFFVKREPWDVQTLVRPYTLCVFRWGQGGRRFENKGRTMWGGHSEHEWRGLTQCHATTYTSYRAEFWVSMDSLEEALKNSSFLKRIPVLENLLTDGKCRRKQSYTGVVDFSRRLDLIARYPSIEYLLKMGFGLLVEELMDGRANGKTINWRGKSAEAVLGMDRQRIRAIRKGNVRADATFMGLFSRMKGVNPMPEMAELSGIADRIRECSLREETFDALASVPTSEKWRALRYIDSAAQKKKGPTVRDIHDYYRDCVKLGIDLTDPYYLCPKNFERMHIETASRVKVEADAETSARIAAYAAKLEPDYLFSAMGLTLRPLQSAEEVIREGNVLKHCVGGYAASYAKHNTILCALRPDAEPEIPWHTVEFSARDGHKIQCRGMKNQTREEDRPILDAFWRAFEAWRSEKARRSA